MKEECLFFIARIKGVDDSSSRWLVKQAGSKGTHERYSFSKWRCPFKNKRWGRVRPLGKFFITTKSLKVEALLKLATKCIKEKEKFFFLLVALLEWFFLKISCICMQNFRKSLIISFPLSSLSILFT